MNNVLARIRLFFRPAAPAPVGRSDEYVQAMVSEAAKHAFAAGFEMGKAQGEIIGREALALELEKAHGIEGGERPMTRDEIAALKLKQRH